MHVHIQTRPPRTTMRLLIGGGLLVAFTLVFLALWPEDEPPSPQEGPRHTPWARVTSPFFGSAESPPVGGPKASLRSTAASPEALAAWQTALDQDEPAFVKRLRKEPALATTIAAVLKDLSGSDEFRQELAIALLQAQPELMESEARKLLHDPDPLAKTQAFEWLKELPVPLKAVTETARQLSLTETEPASVVSALQSLRQSGGLESLQVDPELTRRLQTLAASSDANVRGESVITLVRADRSSDVEPTVLRAFSDTDPFVQKAAIEATVLGGIRSAEAKSQLMRLGLSPQIDVEVRASALEALQSFRLSRDEVTQLAPVQEQLLAAAE